MSDQSNYRSLAAIMFADIVGYSRMMSIDEDRTLDLLKDFEELSSPIVTEFQGKIVKKIEDYEDRMVKQGIYKRHFTKKGKN